MTRSVASGFTLPELVIVLVIVGVLAAFFVPRLTPRASFDLAGFQQELTAGLRYAQKYAVSAGCPVRASINANSFELRHSSSCAAGDFAVLLQRPSGGAYAVAAPSGITLSPAGSFTFAGTGAASTTVTISLTSSAGTREIAVIGPTGYVDIL